MTDTKTIHCKDVEINMGLMVQLERIMPVDKLQALIGGEMITITYEQRRRVLTLITDLSNDEIDELTPEEVAVELGFFTAKLMASSQRGRLLSMVLPFFVISPDEVSQLLETCTELFPQLEKEVSSSLAGRLLSTKPTSAPSVS